MIAMNILVVGAGVVGQATGKGLQRLGHDVVFIDTDPEVVGKLRDQEFWSNCEFVLGDYTDIVFICVPEKNVEAALSKAVENVRKEAHIVVRSTVIPGTCSSLSKKYGVQVFHNPEFLREGVAEFDFLNPEGIVIGADVELPPELYSIYEPFQVPVYVSNTVTTELLKLVVNVYLACQISYWNQIHLIAIALGVNSMEIGMLASTLDPRISSYGARMHGAPYGGNCLPKDVAQMLDMADKINMPYSMLFAIDGMNKCFGGS